MSDLQKRNAKATLQALNEQDIKLQSFDMKLTLLQNQLMNLQSLIMSIKRNEIENLTMNLGNGPTVKSDS